jgi:hypothetical protein
MRIPANYRLFLISRMLPMVMESGYYAHLHDWTFDNDWDYTNEYKHIYSPENNNADHPQSVDVVQIVGVAKNGRAANHFFPGTALLLLPYYLLADGVVQLLSWIGVHVPRNGYAVFIKFSSALFNLYQ